MVVGPEHMDKRKGIDVFFIVINKGIKAEDAKRQKDHEEGVRPFHKAVSGHENNCGHHHYGNDMVFIRPEGIFNKDIKCGCDGYRLQQYHSVNIKCVVCHVVYKAEKPGTVRKACQGPDIQTSSLSGSP